MSDPRNVAHDKKVKQEKEHHHEPSPKDSSATPEVEKVEPQAPGDAEKSAAVLSKLKEMEFHSRANIETLAGLTLTIEDELKQKSSPSQSARFIRPRIIFRLRLLLLFRATKRKARV